MTSVRSPFFSIFSKQLLTGAVPMPRSTTTSPAFSWALLARRAAPPPPDPPEAMVARRGPDVAVPPPFDGLFLRHVDQRAGLLIGDELAMIDDGDPVAQLLRLFEIMGGEHHRDALGAEAADEPP